MRYDQSSVMLPENQSLYINDSLGTIETTFEELDEIDKSLAQKLKSAGLNEQFETTKQLP